MGAAWPWTLWVMMPVNKPLMGMGPGEPGAETRRLITRWGRLHAARSALGGFATLAFLWGCLAL